MAPRTLGVQRGCEHGVHFWNWNGIPRVYGAFLLDKRPLKYWLVCPGETPLKATGAFVQEKRPLKYWLVCPGETPLKSQEPQNSPFSGHVITSVRNHEGAMDK